MPLTTHNQWVKKLAGIIPEIASLELETHPDRPCAEFDAAGKLIEAVGANYFLPQANITFEPQIQVLENDINNSNSVVLGGVLTLAKRSIYFDLKAFGLVQRLITTLFDKIKIFSIRENKN